MTWSARIKFVAGAIDFSLLSACIQRVLGALSLGVKQLECEAHHSPPSNADVKNDVAMTPCPHVFFMA
jgi:hypothetical protein